MKNLGQTHFQCIVVGGGIVGAGIFRDLALHGVETLLIDSGDFSAQTSERSSKMLHGGIRYLENMDFKLVFEALHEKNLWLKLTPHLAREEAFFLPVYKNASRPLWMIRLGLFLYDLLSQFKNSPHKTLSQEECIKRIPDLNSEGLSGAGVYYDGIMDDVKITLEVIYDSLLMPKTFALNHTMLKNVSIDPQTNYSKLTITDQISGEEQVVSAEKVIYALGPFTDSFLTRYPFYAWKNVLLPSKGSHIWISKNDLPLNHPIVMTPKDEFGDRVIFVIPHNEKILIGTTEVPSTGDLFCVTPSKDEINYLLKNLNSYFPKLNLNESHIIGSFAGIRPLVKENENSSDRGKTSREHKIYKPLKNTFVIAGGKYTTFRVMGQAITKEICQDYNKKYDSNLTKKALGQKSVVLPFDWKLPTSDELELICQKEAPRTLEDLIKRRLSIVSMKNWELKTKENMEDYIIKNREILSRHMDAGSSALSEFLKAIR